MGLLARDRTQVSWPGVSCSSMERFHSWSRCVYNYTLGNRILSVYKRRMFWQLLGFFAKSLRKQLWIPSWLLPLAAREPGNTGTRSPAPRPLELALSREASLALLIHGCSGSSHSSCGFSPTKPRVAVCSLQLGLCRSLMRVPAGPASRRGLTLKFQTDDPDSARARTASETVEGTPGDPVLPTAQGPPPFGGKGQLGISREVVCSERLGKKHGACEVALTALSSPREMRAGHRVPAGKVRGVGPSQLTSRRNLPGNQAEEAFLPPSLHPSLLSNKEAGSPSLPLILPSP